MEKIFDDYRGVILFLVIVLALSLLLIMRINNLNDIAETEKTQVKETYYA